MSVLIIGEMYSGSSSFRSNTLIVEESLGSNDSTVVDTHNLPLQDG